MEPDRVLVVDDDPVSRRFATDVLESAGYRTHACASLAEARRALAAFRPGVVLCDLGLPDGSGLALRDDAGGIAFVAVSAELSGARANELLRSGCRGALEKPFGGDRLIAAVGAALAANGTPPEPSAVDDDDLVLDLRAAREATGSNEIADGLRELLLAELPAQRDAVAIALANGDAHAAREVLHRLRSACGFCGTHRLRRAGDALSTVLAQDDPAGIAAARARFESALSATVAALSAARPA